MIKIKKKSKIIRIIFFYLRIINLYIFIINAYYNETKTNNF